LTEKKRGGKSSQEGGPKRGGFIQAWNKEFNKGLRRLKMEKVNSLLKRMGKSKRGEDLG